MGSYPQERLRPLIAGSASGPLEVITVCEQISLSIKHHASERSEDQEPDPVALAQHKLPQQSTRNDQKKEIEDVEPAHRLKRC